MCACQYLDAGAEKAKQAERVGGELINSWRVVFSVFCRNWCYISIDRYL